MYYHLVSDMALAHLYVASPCGFSHRMSIIFQKQESQDSKVEAYGIAISLPQKS